MNLENIDLLSQKVERVLEVLRVLKAEKAQLQSKVDSFESVLAQKDDEIAVLKSSGIGLSISQDQNIALRTIRKNLKNVF